MVTCLSDGYLSRGMDTNLIAIDSRSFGLNYLDANYLDTIEIGESRIELYLRTRDNYNF